MSKLQVDSVETEGINVVSHVSTIRRFDDAISFEWLSPSTAAIQIINSYTLLLAGHASEKKAPTRPKITLNPTSTALGS